MARKTVRVSITKLTENRGELRPPVSVYNGDAQFSATYKHCYFNDVSLRKVKGGIGHGTNGSYGSAGNYVGIEDGEAYHVMQHRDQPIEEGADR